jgi:8-oxo-dGTP pyrophosphatase MutT (NUDIX family)
MRRRNRPAARIVVLDEDGRVLLLRVDDPVTDAEPFWITPGGGLEAGESQAEGAARELAEETGLEIAPDLLGDPVAISRGNWEFRGEPFYSESCHFVLFTDNFELDDSGWDEIERQFHTGWRWWTPEELEASDELIIPDGLADLVRRLHRRDHFAKPVELPWVGS